MGLPERDEERLEQELLRLVEEMRRGVQSKVAPHVRAVPEVEEEEVGRVRVLEEEAESSPVVERPSSVRPRHPSDVPAPRPHRGGQAGGD